MTGVYLTPVPIALLILKERKHNTMTHAHDFIDEIDEVYQYDIREASTNEIDELDACEVYVIASRALKAY